MTIQIYYLWRQIMKNKINKQYNSRDEFLNDDGLTEDEKIEIEEMILLGLEDEEESEMER